MKTKQVLSAVPFVLVLATLESTGDAVVQTSLHNHVGAARLALMLAGVAFLFGYGCTTDFAPADFGQFIGLYIVTLFIVWQIVNFFAFRALPSLPVVVGGALIVIGGLITTFGRR